MTKHPNTRRGFKAPFVLLPIALLGGLVAVQMLNNRAAPTPTMFEQGVSIQEVAARTDARTLVVVSADWCGPCQQYKRGALADERVAALLASQDIDAVIIDHDKQPESVQALGVRAVPFTALMVNGEIVGSFEGRPTTDELLVWVKRGLTPRS